ncbi:MAG: MauE/DoxX family redox-associated membrane protein [Pseudonocardiales bacterium]
MTRRRWHRAAPWLLAALLGVAGTAHFLAPASYQRTIPDALPFPRELVYLSGVAELLCATGLAFRRTRRVAGWATAALFVAVFPANVQMALDGRHAAPIHQVVLWIRLPVQLPLVAWAVQVARHSPAVDNRQRENPRPRPAVGKSVALRAARGSDRTGGSG